jgi:hypothetical protein
MDQIIVDYHFISISDKIECEKMYINGLVQRWIIKVLFLVEINYNDEILQKSLHVNWKMEGNVHNLKIWKQFSKAKCKNQSVWFILD